MGIGGFVGSVLRYLAGAFFALYGPQAFPLSTLVVNVLGSFAIGVVAGLTEKGDVLSPDMRVLIATGLCGGFTTFSAFSYESIGLMQSGEFSYLALYIGLTMALGLVATFLGIALIRAV